MFALATTRSRFHDSTAPNVAVLARAERRSSLLLRAIGQRVAAWEPNLPFGSRAFVRWRRR